MMKEHTDVVLRTDTFDSVTHSTLETILCQDELLNVSELDLFLACLRWAKKKENPREALGSTLGLIRFRALTGEEFARYVCTTGLLANEEQNVILRWFLTGEGDMPENFSSESYLRWDSWNMGDVEFIFFKEIAPLVTTDVTNISGPTFFSVNKDAYIVGVKVIVSPIEGKGIGIYHVSLDIQLKLGNGITLVSKTYDGIPTTDKFTINFDRPYFATANTVYSLYVKIKINMSNGYLNTFFSKQYEYKNSSDLKITVTKKSECTVICGVYVAERCISN
jgi:hypothetical protein